MVSEGLGTRRIIRLDELSSVLRRSRFISMPRPERLIRERNQSKRAKHRKRVSSRASLTSVFPQPHSFSKYRAPDLSCEQVWTPHAFPRVWQTNEKIRLFCSTWSVKKNISVKLLKLFTSCLSSNLLGGDGAPFSGGLESSSPLGQSRVQN